MRKFTKIITLVIMFTLFSMSFLLITSVENTLHQNNTDITLQVKAATIIIDGNASLAVNASSGNGIEGDPYILEDYVIDGSGANCIDIRNTDAYFTIQNCTVFNGLNGIYLENVTNSEVRNNTIHDNARVSGNNEGNGIFLNVSDSNTLISNNIYNNTGGAGLYSGDGVYLKTSDNNVIMLNTIYNNTGGSGWMSGNGIIFQSNCHDNTAINNTIHDNTGGAGDHSGNGIFVFGSWDMTLTNNTIYNNTGGSGDSSGNGISFYGASDNNVIENFIHNNTGTAEWSGNGIETRSGSDDNEFISNIIVDNTQYGVNVSDTNCDNNYFYLNIIWENHNQITTFTDQVGDIGTNSTWVLNFYNKDADDDGDGITNYNETTLNTSPFHYDTDFDGLNDYDELNIYSTDPINNDSDDDGYLDGIEVALGTNPLNPSDYPGKSTPDYSIVIIIVLIIVVSALGAVSAFLFLKTRQLKTENEELMKKSSKLKDTPKKISKQSKGK